MKIIIQQLGIYRENQKKAYCKMKKLLNLVKTSFIGSIYRAVRLEIIIRPKYRKELSRLKGINSDDSQPIIYYLGKPTHRNLGDIAQYYCICNWIKSNYPDSDVYEFSSSASLDKKIGIIRAIANKYRTQDIIVFQSGYTTQDLGGNHEEMHRMVIDAMPSANILMLPQTVFFQKEENKQRCSECYNKASNMLFLARDTVSFEMAKEMFPDIRVKVFPDIVTTLIGNYSFNNERKGILLCRRNDGEKFYSEEELLKLKEIIEESTNELVEITDTSIDISVDDIYANFQNHLEAEFEAYSHYKAIITDRYHGTIFSLISNTPVIVIKTNDHKVVTGVDWFKGVYDDTVFPASSLAHVVEHLTSILSDYSYPTLKPYFKKNYYDKLKKMFELK